MITTLQKKFKQSGKDNKLLFRGSSGGFIIKVVGSILGFVLHIILTRKLGADKYGVYMYVLSWLNFISIVGVMGFSTASTRYFAQYIAQKKWSHFNGYLKFSRRIVWGLSAISVIGVLITSYYLIGTNNNQELFYTFVIGSLALPLINLINVHVAELKGIRKVVISLIPKNVLKQVSMIFLFLIIVWTGIDNVSAVNVMIIDLIALVLCLLFSRYYLRKYLKVIVKKEIPIYETKEWFSTAKDMVLIAGFNMLLFQADQLILGVIKGTYEVGIYAVISKIALGVVFILTAVNSSLSPMIAELYSENKIKNLQIIVRNGANITFGVSTIIVLVVIFLDDFLLNIFGAEFLVGKKPLWILLFAQLINSFAGPAVMLLNMTGFQNYSAKIVAFGAIVNVVLNFLLIPKFGVIGAATATCISMFIWNTLAVYYVFKKIGINSTSSLKTYGNN